MNATLKPRHQITRSPEGAKRRQLAHQLIEVAEEALNELDGDALFHVAEEVRSGCAPLDPERLDRIAWSLDLSQTTRLANAYRMASLLAWAL